jgi:hypothetical protein
VTIEASTDALVAGSALKDILGLQLCSTFKYRVVNAIKNGEGSYNEAFRQLLGVYGSHYVQSVDFGGRARLVIKTSAKKLQHRLRRHRAIWWHPFEARTGSFRAR